MPDRFDSLNVVYEDNHLLAVNKPAMLPTMGVEEDRESLLTVAKEYIRQEYNKPGNVYLGIVSRLDAPVTGIVLIARTSKAAARLSESFRSRDVRKIYLAAPSLRRSVYFPNVPASCAAKLPNLPSAVSSLPPESPAARASPNTHARHTPSASSGALHSGQSGDEFIGMSQ